MQYKACAAPISKEIHIFARLLPQTPIHIRSQPLINHTIRAFAIHLSEMRTMTLIRLRAL
jgi:hypothetical protein